MLAYFGFIQWCIHDLPNISAHANTFFKKKKTTDIIGQARFIKDLSAMVSKA